MRLNVAVALTTIATAAVLPASAHASYGSASDCAETGGTVVEHFRRPYSYYEDLGYRLVDEQTTWICGRIRIVNVGEFGIKIIVQTPPELGRSALPTIDSDVPACGIDVAAGAIGPDRVPYRLAYATGTSAASVCLTAGPIAVRVTVAVPAGNVPTPPSITAEPTTGPGTNDDPEEIAEPPSSQPSASCGDNTAVDVLGYRITAYANFYPICFRVGDLGGRIDVDSKRALPGVGAIPSAWESWRCDTNLWDSTAPVRAHVSYQSLPDAEGRQWICIEYDEQPLTLIVYSPKPDPNDPPTITFTPDS